MKAVAQYQALGVSDPNVFVDINVPIPEPDPTELIVEIQAVSVNPADIRVRMRKIDDGQPSILGWDAVGVVYRTGVEVTEYNVGDRVWYAGSLAKSGTNCEYHRVDSRLVSLAPDNLQVDQAAALPLVSLTAFELLHNQLGLPETSLETPHTLLIVNGAGGVGSVLIQLAKRIHNLRVVATASRPQSQNWCRKNGADLVINHHEDLVAQLADNDIDGVHFAAILASPDQYWSAISDSMIPYGKVVGIVPFAGLVDLNPLMQKSISFSWEFMFTAGLFNANAAHSQHEILDRCRQLVEHNQLVAPVTQTLHGINSENIRLAHQIVEQNSMIGKITITQKGNS